MYFKGAGGSRLIKREWKRGGWGRGRTQVAVITIFPECNVEYQELIIQFDAEFRSNTPREWKVESGEGRGVSHIAGVSPIFTACLSQHAVIGKRSASVLRILLSLYLLKLED